MCVSGEGIPTVFIAVAGRSNGLGPVLCGNATWPVINCPPVTPDWGAQDVWSSLRLPSGEQLWDSSLTLFCIIPNIFLLPVFVLLTRMQCKVSLCNGDSVRLAGVVKNFNIGYILLNIRGRLLIFGILIDHMDLYPPDL